MAYIQPGNTPLHKKEVKKVKAKGGGTKKVCLPKAKIASMSKEERQKVTTFTQIEDSLKILLLVITIGYTISKWINIKKENE